MNGSRLFNRGFTLLILGQASSLFGNYTLRFALSMYVLELTGSAAVFSTLLAVSMLPTILLSPLGGVLADRANRRSIMVTLDARSAQAVLAARFAGGRTSGVTAVGVLLVALSVLGAFESPTVQACVPQLLSGDNVLRGNALVSQVQAVASLVTPFLGSVVYASFGLAPVVHTAAACFFVTAVLECFIRLDSPRTERSGGVLSAIRGDLAGSWRFMRREEPGVLSLLLLAALVSMFLSGVMVVGFPFLVRTVLGLSAQLYGAAESAAGVAAILGSLAVTILAGRLLTERLWLAVTAAGVCLIPSALAFALPIGTIAAYAVLTVSFCCTQAVCSAFSVCAMTTIQSRTPEHLTGKVMAFVYTISLCAQPLGQLLYGALFDALASAPEWLLLPSALAVIATGLASKKLFAGLAQRGK